MRLLSRLLLIVLLSTGAACSGGEDDSDRNDEDVTTPMVDASPSMCQGDLAYMESCTSNDECSTCLCFTYGMGEMRCSKECETNADCPAPSPGCSGKGVCKRPGG